MLENMALAAMWTLIAITGLYLMSKRDKAYESEVELPKCTKCGAYAVLRNRPLGWNICLKCGASQDEEA